MIRGKGESAARGASKRWLNVNSKLALTILLKGSVLHRGSVFGLV